MGHDGDLSEARSDCGNVTAIQRPVDPGYVIRTNSLKGRMKVFINVCKSEVIAEPSFTNMDGNRDVLWNVPHGLGCARDEHAKRGERFKVYDFIIHPHTFRMTETIVPLKKVIDDLAVESVMKRFSVRVDRKSLTFPEMRYKGTANSVGYVENVTNIAIDGNINGLEELCGYHCSGEETGRNGSKCQASFTGGEESECVNNENKWDADCSGKNIYDDCNGIVMSMANGDLPVKDIDKGSVFTDEPPVTDILPDYKSQQDESTLTFIFAVKRVKNENVFFSVVSPQEICLKMMTVSDKGFPLCYTCYLKFSCKCRLMESGCHVDVSEVNVVLTVAKAEKSRKTWNTYFIGTSPQHLEVRDFVTVDNLKRELDSLDLNANSDVDDKQKTTGNVNVVAMNDEKLVLEIKKAEETELDDVPGEIIVIHERGIPRLHGILKQRSMSESSDDLSFWSNSTDRRTSTATGSETESDEDESSRGPFRPRLKKSVSFNEHIDQTMFVANQSISQMHSSLKNKRRRIRKREQKLDLKESKRRHRSNSDSCSHDERDFDCRPLEDRILASMLKMKSTVDKPEHMDAGAEGETSSADVECNGRSAFVPRNEDTIESNKDKGKADEDIMIAGDVEGTSRSRLELFPDITSLETCGGTENGEGSCNLHGDNLITEVDGSFRAIKCPITTESHLYTPVERTSGCGGLSGLKPTLKLEENLSSDRTFNSSGCSVLKEKSNDDVMVGIDLFDDHFASCLSVNCPREKVKYNILENGKNSDSDDNILENGKNLDSDDNILENGKNSDSDDVEEEVEEEEENGIGILSMLL